MTQKPDKRQAIIVADRRDHIGRIVFMAASQRYVMCRRPGKLPFVMREDDWRALPAPDYDEKANET